MINLKKLAPMEVITRNLLIADLATIPGELVAKVTPELCIEMEHQVKDDDGEIKTTTTQIVNWGKVLFETNTPKLEFILSHFQRRDLVITEKEQEVMKEKAQEIFSSLAGGSKPEKEDGAAQIEKDWKETEDKMKEGKGGGLSSL